MTLGDLRDEENQNIFPLCYEQVMRCSQAKLFFIKLPCPHLRSGNLLAPQKKKPSLQLSPVTCLSPVASGLPVACGDPCHRRQATLLGTAFSFTSSWCSGGSVYIGNRPTPPRPKCNSANGMEWKQYHVFLHSSTNLHMLVYRLPVTC